MDQTLGLLGCGGGGTGTDQLSNETSTAFSKMEKDYMGFSSSVSSNDTELELGLGLSLGSGGHGAGGMGKGKGIPWGEYGRILTAKDLPNGFSGRAGAVSGTKRAAADSVSQNDNGSPSAGVISQVVGWPPIRAYRMNSLVNQSKLPNVEDDKGVGGNEKKELENSKKKINCGNNHKNDDNNNIAPISIKEKNNHLGFIKVNMDGLPIGRKVDLNAHTCYESLARALEDMFLKSTPTINSICKTMEKRKRILTGKNMSEEGQIGVEKEQARQPPKLLDESSEFVLTYEDKEGDWMLVGDVPWGMFLCTVKRLRIMRTSEANGLAPRPQEKYERQKGKPI